MPITQVTEKWPFSIGAYLILETLGTKMYRDTKACLWEVVRNGLNACMPQGLWQPKKGYVEILLVDNHPLAPRTKSLVIFDRGSGFTQQAIKLYCCVGASVEDRKRSKNGSHNGTALNRVGRFATLALNSKCMDDLDANSGFYILTRTSASGQVKLVNLTPAAIQSNQVEAVPVNSDATELGPHKKITGSFTAVVIPNSVFNTYKEIREALQWYVPRKPDLMFNLIIDGKPLNPPQLPSKVTILQDNGPIEIYADRVEKEEGPENGLWLVDAETGLRAAYAPALSQYLPYPLWSQLLTGDIFLPNLYANQDSSRTTLTPKYFNKSEEWLSARAYLGSQVCPRLKALIGDDDALHTNKPLTSILLNIVQMCNKRFGVPDSVHGPMLDVPGINGNGSGHHNGRHTGTHRESEGSGSSGRPSGEHKARRQTIPIRVGDKDFFVVSKPMRGNVLAQVNNLDGRTLFFNEKYECLPPRKDYKDEHILMGILNAVGQYLYPDNSFEASCFANQTRRELLNR